MSSPAAGWYHDPHNSGQARWWDGHAWTIQTRELPPSARRPAPTSLGPAATSTPTSAPGPATPAPIPRVDHAALAPAHPGETSHDASVVSFADTRAPITYTDLGKEPSPGAAGLASFIASNPPAPENAPPPPPPSPPSGGGKRTAIGLLVTGALVAVVAVAGYVVYSSSKLGGGSGREPSSDAVKVYEGPGYSVEAPKTWTYVSKPTKTIDMGFIAPNGASVWTVSSDDVSATEAELSDPATRKIVFDTIIRILQAVAPSSQVVSRTEVELGGVPGERVVLTYTHPTTGQPVRAEAFLAADSSGFYGVGLEGTPEATSEATVAASFRAIVDSFRLE